MIKRIAKRAAPIAALAIGAGLSGCAYTGSWDTVEGVAFKDFTPSGTAPNAIGLAGPDEIVITQSDTFEITLDGDSRAGEALRFDRTGEQLNIARDSNVYNGGKTAIVRIAMPAPSELELAGSGKINSATMAPNAEVEIAGSGQIHIDELAAQEFEVEMAGSGKLRAAGAVERLSIEIAGSASVDMAGVMADNVDIDIAGSGEVDLASNGVVNADIAGSGEVTVTGSATCTVDAAGSGTLDCRPAEATAATQATPATQATEATTPSADAEEAE